MAKGFKLGVRGVFPEGRLIFVSVAHGHDLFTRRHRHAFSEIFLVAEGVVHHSFGTGRQALPAGSLVYVRPDDSHAFSVAPGVPVTLANLAFARKVESQAVRFLDLGREAAAWKASRGPVMRLLPAHRTAELATRLCGLALPHQPPVSDLQRILVELLWELKDGQGMPAVPSPVPAWLENACHQMRDSVHLAGGMKRFRALAGVGAAHLSRCMRRYKGATPAAFLTGLRLAEAARLLLTSDRKVQDIALSCGYPNLSHFHHVFLRRHGLSPAAFRRQGRELPAGRFARKG